MFQNIYSLCIMCNFAPTFLNVSNKEKRTYNLFLRVISKYTQFSMPGIIWCESRNGQESLNGISGRRFTELLDKQKNVYLETF